MAITLTDDAVWANGLAARLRVLQSNFADDNPATRQGYIIEEIERALKAVPSNKRKACLDALGEQFPAWQSAAAMLSMAEPAKAQAQTPEEALEQLIAFSAGLPDATRAEFAKKLEAAGLAPKAQAASGSLELPPELQKKLGFAAGQAAHAERSVKALATLADLVLTLDQLVWILWTKQLAPKSNIRKEADVVKLLGQYLKGDPEVSTQQVVQSLERTRKLVAALLGGIGRAGATYGSKYTQRFSPEAILDLAKIERGFAAVEVKAWRKYVELAKESASQQAIESEIQEAIAKAAENLMMGRAGI